MGSRSTTCTPWRCWSGSSRRAQWWRRSAEVAAAGGRGAAELRRQWRLGFFGDLEKQSKALDYFSYDKYSLMQSFYEQVYEITTFLSKVALNQNVSYNEGSSPWIGHIHSNITLI